MAATKFTEAEREKLFAQLETPFDPMQIKWRVMRTSAMIGGRRRSCPSPIRARTQTGSTNSSRRRDGRASTRSPPCHR